MPDHDQHHDDRHQDFLEQRRVERTQCFIDQAGPVVERNDCHLADGAIGQRLFWQANRNLGDFLFHVFDRRQRIFPVTNHHHTTHRFGAFLVQRAAAQSRSKLHAGDVLDVQRHVVVDLDHGILDVGQLLDETDAADDILDLVDLDRPRADVEIRHLDRLYDFVEPHAVRPHRVRVDVHLVFLDKPADRCHFAHARGR